MCHHVRLMCHHVSSRPQVEKCKLLIREAIKACEEAGGQRAIAEAAYDSDGGLDQAHIFCAACNGIESFEVGVAASSAGRSPLQG